MEITTRSADYNDKESFAFSASITESYFTAALSSNSATVC